MFSVTIQGISVFSLHWHVHVYYYDHVTLDILHLLRNLMMIIIVVAMMVTTVKIQAR